MIAARSLRRPRDPRLDRHRVFHHVDSGAGQLCVPGAGVLAFDFDQLALAQVIQLAAQLVGRKWNLHAVEHLPDDMFRCSYRPARIEYAQDSPARFFLAFLVKIKKRTHGYLALISASSSRISARMASSLASIVAPNLIQSSRRTYSSGSLISRSTNCCRSFSNFSSASRFLRSLRSISHQTPPRLPAVKVANATSKPAIASQLIGPQTIAETANDTRPCSASCSSTLSVPGNWLATDFVTVAMKPAGSLPSCARLALIAVWISVLMSASAVVPR